MVSHITGCQPGKPGQESGSWRHASVTDTETMVKQCLWIALTSYPEVTSPAVNWARPPVINNQENALTETPIGQSDGSNSVIEVLPSLGPLVSVKLRKTNWHTMKVCVPFLQKASQMLSGYGHAWVKERINIPKVRFQVCGQTKSDASPSTNF